MSHWWLTVNFLLFNPKVPEVKLPSSVMPSGEGVGGAGETQREAEADKNSWKISGSAEFQIKTDFSIVQRT